MELQKSQIRDARRVNYTVHKYVMFQRKLRPILTILEEDLHREIFQNFSGNKVPSNDFKACCLFACYHEDYQPILSSGEWLIPLAERKLWKSYKDVPQEEIIRLRQNDKNNEEKRCRTYYPGRDDVTWKEIDEALKRDPKAFLNANVEKERKEREEMEERERRENLEREDEWSTPLARSTGLIFLVIFITLFLGHPSIFVSGQGPTTFLWICCSSSVGLHCLFVQLNLLYLRRKKRNGKLASEADLEKIPAQTETSKYEKTERFDELPQVPGKSVYGLRPRYLSWFLGVLYLSIFMFGLVWFMTSAIGYSQLDKKAADDLFGSRVECTIQNLECTLGECTGPKKPFGWLKRE